MILQVKLRGWEAKCAGEVAQGQWRLRWASVSTR